MHIHYLSGSRIPSTDANSVHVVKMCNAFAGLGHDVVLFCRRTGLIAPDLVASYGVQASFHVERLPYTSFPLAGPWLYSRRVWRQSHKRGRPDLYYARHIHALRAVIGAGVPMILECHAPPESFWQDRAFREVLRSHELTRIVAISAALRDELMRLYPDISPRMILVAHDGADPWQSLKIEPMAVGGREGALQAGYTGHLYPGKGMELIANLALVVADVDFHIVGGTAKDIARWKLRAPSPNIRFHGFVPHRQIPQYLAAFDVLLAPYQDVVATSSGKGDISRWMSPLKIFEYMASNKPIVASNLPVLREVLTDDRNALLCGPSDHLAWQAALRRLTEDGMLATRLASEARRNLATQYSWQARAQRVVS